MAMHIHIHGHSVGIKDLEKFCFFPGQGRKYLVTSDERAITGYVIFMKSEDSIN